MSAATVLIVVGFLLLITGVGVALLARFRPGPVGHVFAPEDVVVAAGFEEMARVFRSIDQRIKIGVGVAVAGLLLAGLGAYLGSDARALGADVGGGGSNDNARVGGSW